MAEDITIEQINDAVSDLNKKMADFIDAGELVQKLTENLPDWQEQLQAKFPDTITEMNTQSARLEHFEGL